MPNRYLSEQADKRLDDIMDRNKNFAINRSGAIVFLYDFYITTIKEDGMELLYGDEKQ